ncbi:MAG: GNAT family N-acetyltransferase [Saprospiraceae bacterium]
MKFRSGTPTDAQAIERLIIDTWQQFEKDLTSENWNQLSSILTRENTYESLLKDATSFVCENEKGEIIGVGFLVPSGNPTDIYTADQSYIRLVTVSDAYKGLKFGQKITELCIQYAKQSGEQKIALHTSEMMFKARHIYEKLGFKILREIEPRFGKRYWLYEMDL